MATLTEKRSGASAGPKKIDAPPVRPARLFATTRQALDARSQGSERTADLRAKRPAGVLFPEDAKRVRHRLYAVRK